MNRIFIFIFVLLICCLTFFCKSDTKSACLYEPATAQIEFKGKVKSVNTKCFRAIEKFGKIEEGNVIDDSSNVNSLTIYDEGGHLILYETYDALNITTAKLTGKKENGECLKSIEFHFDDTLYGFTFYYYDYENMIREDKNIDNKNIVTSVTKTKFNSKEEPIEITTYDPKGNKKNKIIKEYNGDSKLILEISLDSNDVKTSTCTYRYDKKQNAREFANRNHEHPNENYGTFEKYNEKGDIIEYRYISKSVNSLTISTYVYDKKGNWIKKTQVKNGQPELIVKRTIEYY